MRSLNDHLTLPDLGEPLAGPGVVEGSAGGSCGVLCTFWMAVSPEGVIDHVSARVRGRACAFALASALVESSRGRTIVDAARLGINTVHGDFQTLDEDDVERAMVVEDAFHHALGNWCVAESRRARDRDHDRTRDPDHDRTRDPDRSSARAGLRASGIESPRSTTKPKSALVAMSGGVDSAVALHRAGHDPDRIVGTTLRLWIDPQAPDPEAACCAPSSVRRARHTCHQRGLPHISIDLRKGFAQQVVAPFIASYSAGETPNPCVGCNGHFRLDEMVHIADALGLDELVTGHYARLVERDGEVLLQRAIDHTKDQSYMLARTTQAVLSRMRFPLGEQTKTHTRAQAEQLGMVQAQIPDSQEVCFLGGGDYRGFLERRGALGIHGEIHHVDGTVLGVHEGIARFTPGQRRGLGPIQHHDGGPLYVVGVSPKTGVVTVGPVSALDTKSVSLASVRLHESALRRPVSARLRYRAGLEGQSGRVVPTDNRTAVLEFDEPVRAPAPGQLACLYDEDGVVVGTGFIIRDR